MKGRKGLNIHIDTFTQLLHGVTQLIAMHLRPISACIITFPCI